MPAGELHGLRRSPEYGVWAGMKQRCLNPNSERYHRYGGRGIRICKEWLNSFTSFLRDMGQRPSPKHTLERVDNNGGYSKGNCVWATKAEQARNKARTRRLTINGVTKLLEVWAAEYGINLCTARYRYVMGLRGEAVVAPRRKASYDRSRKTSKYFGVSWSERIKRWHVSWRINKKKHSAVTTDEDFAGLLYVLHSCQSQLKFFPYPT